MRILLTNYLNDGHIPNILRQRLIGPQTHLDRHMFDEAMCISSSDLNHLELESYRRRYHEDFVHKFRDIGFGKVHESYRGQFSRKVMFPSEPNCKLIYLVRNPLDVASSYAHHRNRPIDEIIELMANSNAVVEHGETSFCEYTNSWSNHVAEWVDQDDLPMLVIRYEDLLEHTSAAFSSVVEFSGIELKKRQLDHAIEYSEFNDLQSQERENGFLEIPQGAPRFFRSGRSGSWRKTLSKLQVERIKTDHGEQMERFGYL